MGRGCFLHQIKQKYHVGDTSGLLKDQLAIHNFWLEQDTSHTSLSAVVLQNIGWQCPCPHVDFFGP